MTQRVSVPLVAGVALALLASVVYLRMLGDREQYYMLMFYLLVGAAFYVMSKYLGKEIYILLLLPRIIVGGNLAYLCLNISNNDLDLQNPFKTHILTLMW